MNKVAGNFHFAPGKSFQQHNVHIHDLQVLLTYAGFYDYFAAIFGCYPHMPHGEFFLVLVCVVC